MSKSLEMKRCFLTGEVTELDQKGRGWVPASCHPCADCICFTAEIPTCLSTGCSPGLPGLLQNIEHMQHITILKLERFWIWKHMCTWVLNLHYSSCGYYYHKCSPKAGPCISNWGCWRTHGLSFSHVHGLSIEVSPAWAWVSLGSLGICHSLLMRLQATPFSFRASVSLSEPEFHDFWRFHLVSLISPPPTPQIKAITNQLSLASLCLQGWGTACFNIIGFSPSSW